MKAFILAAGEGTRLRPLTLDRPKQMVPILGRPLLEHTLALLRLHGVHDIAINLHYKPEVVTAYLASIPSFRFVYSYENPILGTAGAAKKVEAFLDSTFFLIYGDVLTDLDLSALLEFHRSTSAQMTIAVYRVEDPERCGIVEADLSGRVRSFVEKPANPSSNLASTGIYVMEPAILRHIPDGFSDFGYHVIPELIGRGIPIYCVTIGPGTYLLDIGSLERYEQACRDAEEGRVRLLSLDA